MRKTLPLILSACISLTFVPAQAQLAGDASDSFLNAYTAYQKAEKLEAGGNSRAALTSYKEAARTLDQIAQRWPSWNPTIVDYRRKRTAEAISKVEDQLKARPLPGELLPPSNVEPPLPGEGASLIPSLPPPRESTAPIPSSSGSGGFSDPIREIQDRMNRLQQDLQASRDELEKLRHEKEDLAKQLEASNKTKAKAEEAQRVLQQRADMAEQALIKANQDETRDDESLKILQAERDKLRKELRAIQIERDAAEEVRQQLASRLSNTQNRVAALTKERDAASKSSGQAAEQIAEAQKKMEAAIKEKELINTKLAKVTEERDAAAKLSKEAVAKAADAEKKMDAAVKEKELVSTKLAKITQERDDVASQLAKLKEAQKNVDKLLTENTQLMAKLGDAEKQIAQFKLGKGSKDEQVVALRKELTTVQTKLAEAEKQNADSQKVMAELQAKLDSTMQNLAPGKVTPGATPAEQQRIAEENEILRGIVLRQLKEQARRNQTRELVMAELSKMQIKSKSLLEQVDYLGQPVVKLTDKERALFKKPQIEISETEVSIAAMKPEVPATVDAKPEATTPLESVMPNPKPVPTQNPAPAGTDDLPTKSPEDNLSVAMAPSATSKVTSAPAPSATAKGAQPDPIPDELLPMVQEAKDLFQKANYKDAEKVYEKILAKAPNNLYALSNLGVTRFRGGKLKGAEEAFRKAIAIAPNDAFSHCTLGIVFYAQGKFDNALDELTKAISINPKDATAYNYLGITASQKGWQEAAQKQLETATALDPNYADAHFNLAVVYATQQPPNKEGARRYYKRATELGAEPDAQLEELIK